MPTAPSSDWSPVVFAAVSAAIALASYVAARHAGRQSERSADAAARTADAAERSASVAAQLRDFECEKHDSERRERERRIVCRFAAAMYQAEAALSEDLDAQREKREEPLMRSRRIPRRLLPPFDLVVAAESDASFLGGDDMTAALSLIIFARSARMEIEEVASVPIGAGGATMTERSNAAADYGRELAERLDEFLFKRLGRARCEAAGIDPAWVRSYSHYRSLTDQR